MCSLEQELNRIVFEGNALYFCCCCFLTFSLINIIENASLGVESRKMLKDRVVGHYACSSSSLRQGDWFWTFCAMPRPPFPLPFNLAWATSQLHFQQVCFGFDYQQQNCSSQQWSTAPLLFLNCASTTALVVFPFLCIFTAAKTPLTLPAS